MNKRHGTPGLTSILTSQEIKIYVWNSGILEVEVVGWGARWTRCLDYNHFSLLETWP